MKIFTTYQELSHWRNSLSHSTLVGFVPTMGALHEGHISLVIKAKETCDIVIASIFVNPLQFNQAADFEAYPHTLEADCELLKQVQCDVVFAPNVSEMYPKGPIDLQINFGPIEHVLEGAQRPGHFSGVGVVVSRLFNWVKPNKAFFGLKDLQQVRVVQKLVDDLGFYVDIIACPTSRNTEGLALSSRNSRLSLKGLSIAPAIYQAMCQAATFAPDVASMKEAGIGYLAQFPQIEIAYFEIADSLTLQQFDTNDQPKEIAIVVAVWLEGVRLIDNLILSN